MQWVPGHVGLAGNEKVDEIAKQACQMNQESTEIDYGTASAVIKRNCERKWRSDLQARKPPTGNTESNLSRRERCTLAQLRAGEHCPILRSYLKRIGVVENGQCRRCKQQEEDWNHVLVVCPGYNDLRKKIFKEKANKSMSWTRPEQVMRFIRESGLLK